ncbi:MBL fold metallo-hydrolase [Roseicyclus marinus]|uniref:MBL fold metallo-hydrolase n=1 Tax=Roseicyclus marinus TaxID=2161673 RepID=UPI00240F40C2|nr:MBL fold metallo-hydrolase [Roseicyclus marinus]MDG3042548.1 MBL fold metallo-hydrolase [Roseicyclus marinus]
MILTAFEAAPAPGEAVEVADGVLWLRIPLPMVLDHVNAYALRDDDGWTLVDTGLDSRKTRAIWEAALAGPLQGVPVRRLVVTHHHPDHVGLAGWFQSQGAELWMTRTAWLMARMLTLDEQPLPTPETLDFWRGAGMDAAVFEARRAERPFNFCDMVHPMPLGFSRLKDGDSFSMGGRVWDIRFGQGHAPDHATFWSRDDGLVIGGDQMLATISPNLGVYATEPGADPVGDWLESCAGFVPHARPDHLVLPGHKLPFSGLPDRLRQMIDNHTGALGRLCAHLETGPKTAADCFPPLFKRQIDGGTYGLALVEAVAHLNHLLATGAIRRERRADGAWLYHRAG